MDDRTVVVNVKCREPEGEVVRSVRLARLSIDRMAFLWEKLKGFDTLFNDFVKGDYKAFVNHFVLEVNGEPVPTGLLWDVDDVGIFLLHDIIPYQSATAHFVFWDKRFRGREDLCIECLKYAFETYKFQRIKVEVPLYAHHTMDAVEKMGFVLEGRMRKAVLYHDKWFDVNIYSMLPDEAGVRGKSGEAKRVTSCFKCGGRFNLMELVRKTEGQKKVNKKLRKQGADAVQQYEKEVKNGWA